MCNIGYKATEEHKRKISLALTGRKLSEAHKRKISKLRKGAFVGNKNSNWKGGKPKCVDCGKLLSKYGAERCCKCQWKIFVPETAFKKGSTPWNTGKGGTYSLVRKCEKTYGKNAPNWKGGIAPLNMTIRSLIENILWRTNVFQRDNYACQKCGKHNGQGKRVILEAHHKKHFAVILNEFLQEYNQFSPLEDRETLVRLAMKYKPFWEIDNGQTLCKDCHKLTKSERVIASRSMQ